MPSACAVASLSYAWGVRLYPGRRLFGLPAKEAHMTNTESEAALDDLLQLGYAVEISDSGAITARLDSDVI
jgi:hypothetical protein